MKYLLVLTLFLLALYLLLSHQKIDTLKIQKDIDDRVRLDYIDNVSVAYLNTKKTTFYSAGNFPCPPQDAIYEIGSLTKMFTAHLCLILEEEKLLSLDAPVETYLSGKIKFLGEIKKPVTLRHLLTHTSGLKDPSIPNYEHEVTRNTVIAAEYTIDDLYHYINQTPLESDPGTKILYSNLGYGLVGHILEKVSGKPFFSLLKEKILDPVQMQHTFLEVPAPLRASFLKGKKEVELMPYWEIPYLPAFGALKSTATDLSLYIRSLLFDKSNPFAKELLHPYLEWDKDQIFITTGWTIDKRHGSNLYVATGKTLGFSSFIGFDKRTKEAIILLTNTSALDNLGHSWFNDKFVVAPLHQVVKLTQSQLTRLSGNYSGEGEMQDEQITITAKEGFIEMHSPGERPLLFFPIDESHFFSKHLNISDSIIEFKMSRENKMSLAIKTNGKEMTFKKE